MQKRWVTPPRLYKYDQYGVITSTPANQLPTVQYHQYYDAHAASGPEGREVVPSKVARKTVDARRHAAQKNLYAAEKQTDVARPSVIQRLHELGLMRDEVSHIESQRRLYNSRGLWPMKISGRL